MKTYYVEVFENNEGYIHAVVRESAIDQILNIVSGLESSSLTGEMFITAARTGFEYADPFDPAEYNGQTKEKVADELEHKANLIAIIRTRIVHLEEHKMGIAGKKLFEIKE